MLLLPFKSDWPMIYPLYPEMQSLRNLMIKFIRPKYLTED